MYKLNRINLVVFTFFFLFPLCKIFSYTITAVAQYNAGSISPSGWVNVNPGDSVTFTIIPNPGYIRFDVKVDGISQGPIERYTFRDVKANHTITASFVDESYGSIYIGATAEPGGTVSGFGTFQYGTQITIKATPDPAFEFSHWTENGSTITYSQTFSITCTEPRFFTAHFIPLPGVHVISASAGSGGFISPYGNICVNSGDSKTFYIGSNTGYSVSDVIVDGSSVGGIHSYTFFNVNENHTISASFIPSYTVMASAGMGGSISPNSSNTVKQGEDITFTIDAYPNYYISDVMVDGTSVGAIGSYTFNDVSADHSISASFNLKTFTISGHIYDRINGNPLVGGKVSFSSGAADAITDATGYYSAILEYGWNGTATPSASGVTLFAPSSKIYEAITTNLSEQDYMANPLGETSPIISIETPSLVIKQKNVPDNTPVGNEWYSDKEKCWYLDRIQAYAAWKIASNNNNKTIVGIIGEYGVQLNHPDLLNVAWVNPGESGIDNLGRDKKTNGIDDDGNGYVDDINGWNFNNNNNDISDGMDGSHGTCIAGVISAVTNKKCKIIGFKDLNENYETEIQYSISSEARVLTCSQTRVPNVDQIRDAFNKIILSIAAGNYNADLSSLVGTSFGIDESMTIAATMKFNEGQLSDSKIPISNYGTVIDVSAPGTDIYTTNKEGNYISTGGTSFSSPIVAGIAGLILNENPYLSSPQVINIIKSSADNISKDNPGYEDKLGTGRVNAFNAVLMAKNCLTIKNVGTQLLIINNIIENKDWLHISDLNFPIEILPGKGKTFPAKIDWTKTLGNPDIARVSIYSNDPAKPVEYFEVSIIPDSGSSVLTVSENMYEVSPANGLINIDIFKSGTGTMDWTITKDQDWIELSRSNGTDNGNVTIHYKSNQISTERVGFITVEAPGAANSPQVIEIKQASGMAYTESRMYSDLHLSSPTDFGATLAISDDYAVAGCLPSSKSLGYCSLFKKVNGIWNFIEMFRPNDAVLNRFGGSVAISENYLAITGIENNGSNAVYIYRNDNISLSPTKFYIQGYANSISMSGNLLAVAVEGSVSLFSLNNNYWTQFSKFTLQNNSSYKICLSGNYLCCADPSYKEVYIYRIDGYNCTFLGKLIPSNTAQTQTFGISVCIDGNTIMVAGSYDDIATVFVYEKTGQEWTNATENIRIYPSYCDNNSGFGSSFFPASNNISIRGDYAIVGAYQDNDNGINSGAVYIFKKISGNWEYFLKINSSYMLPNTYFGSSVAINANDVLVGAVNDEVFAPGGKIHDGAVYFYTFNNLLQKSNSDVSSKNSILPDKYALLSNYPNPFNPTTEIVYDLPEDSYVRLGVYDVLGKKVAELVNDVKGTGSHKILWNGKNSDGSSCSSGIYIYRIESNSIQSDKSFTASHKMIMLK